MDVERTSELKSIDWGSLIVYSCSRSCSSETEEVVVEEFLARQMLDKLV